MATNLLGIGSIRSLLVAYRTNASQDGAEMIPLGVLADMRIGERYGIGLRARHRISDNEAQKIGQLVRPRLVQPFGLLQAEFDRVQAASDPAEAFAGLRAYEASAIAFFDLEARTVAAPSGLITGPDSEALREWILDQVKTCLADRFWPFVDAVADKGRPDTATAVTDYSSAA